VIVGRSAAQKLQAMPGCAAQAVHDDLDQALSHSGPGLAADVLLVHLPSLQAAAAGQVLALGARLGTPSIIVVYAFGTELVAESLRAAGATVRREPATGRDLARHADREVGGHVSDQRGGDAAQRPVLRPAQLRGGLLDRKERRQDRQRRTEQAGDEREQPGGSVVRPGLRHGG
jgi:hypothetical protein